MQGAARERQEDGRDFGSKSQAALTLAMVLMLVNSSVRCHRRHAYLLETERSTQCGGSRHLDAPVPGEVALVRYITF